ncbi:uncharacterized protein LOC133351083 [Lethenteron reissneri]|uniref:uncharacterized protein LOC133351083 n=1 Tax=Lethenteron reissneri TaxID=7753 RepID=UPI002AB73772|nr:uncharacterized protein LOC133351083 [Lethenteron reissneri]
MSYTMFGINRSKIGLGNKSTYEQTSGTELVRTHLARKSRNARGVQIDSTRTRSHRHMAGVFARRWGLRLGVAAVAVYILVIISQRPRGTEYEISKDQESHLEDTPVLVDEALDEPVWPELARPSRATRRRKRPESQVRPPSLCGPGSSWVHCFQPIRLQWPGAHARQATEAAPSEAPPGSGLHRDPDEEGGRRRIDEEEAMATTTTAVATCKAARMCSVYGTCWTPSASVWTSAARCCWRSTRRDGGD